MSPEEPRAEVATRADALEERLDGVEREVEGARERADEAHERAERADEAAASLAVLIGKVHESVVGEIGFADEEADRRFRDLRAFLAVDVLLTAIAIAAVVALCGSAAYRAGEAAASSGSEEPSCPIVYVPADCPVCGEPAIASTETIVCNNEGCPAYGLPVDRDGGGR